MDIVLKAGNASATAATLGGELSGYVAENGLQYIWQGDTASWTGRNPCLFPTVGAVKGRETVIEGSLFPLKKHGFARKCEWQLVNQEPHTATFLLRSGAHSSDTYPYDFNLFCRNTVFTDGFSMRYTVRNTHAAPIFFGLGGHTGYTCPLFPGTRFEDYSVVFARAENGPFYYTDLTDCDGVIHPEGRAKELEGVTEIPLSYSLFDKDVLVISNLASQTVKLIHRESGKGISVSFTGFKHLGLWTAPGKAAPYLCLEPWTCLPDFSDAPAQFSQKPDIIKLEPGAEYSAETRVTLI